MAVEGWRETTLDELSDIRRGASPRPINDPKWFSDKGPGWVRISDVTKSYKYLRKTEQSLSELGVSKSVPVKPGDVIMSICATIGVPKLVDMHACIHDGFVLFDKLRPEIDREYLFYFLHTAVSRYLSMGQPGTQINLNTSIVKGTPINLPPLNEQKKIVEILGSVDEAIAKTEAVIAQTQKVKQGLLQTLLTKGIGHTKFKQTEFGNMPEEWRIVALQSVAHLQTGIAKNKKQPDDSVNLPYLRVANVQDGFIDTNEIKSITLSRRLVERYLLQDGDVLITEGGDFDKLGRGAVWKGQVNPCLHQNHVFAIRTDKAVLDPVYLSYLFLSPHGKGYFLNSAKQTTNLASINSTQVKKFPVLLPTIQEQRQIIQKINSIDALQYTNQQQYQALKDTKSGLMSDLLTGRVRVSLDKKSEKAA